jgi:DNA-binding FadR family transcriptional regulator
LARKQTSEFYTSLRAALEATGKSSFTAEQRQQLEELIAQRDDVITLLARSDPASAERLSNLHVSVRQVIGPSANVE